MPKHASYLFDDAVVRTQQELGCCFVEGSQALYGQVLLVLLTLYHELLCLQHTTAVQVRESTESSATAAKSVKRVTQKRHRAYSSSACCMRGRSPFSQRPAHMASALLCGTRLLLGSVWCRWYPA